MSRGLFPLHGRCGRLATLAAAGLLTMTPGAWAQSSNGQPAGTSSVTLTKAEKKAQAKAAKDQANAEKKQAKAEKVVKSKDTKKQLRQETKVSKKNPLLGLDKNAPDKQLYDKAITAINKGRFDIARLDLQVLLNTYPDSQYQMQAKLAMADSWFREGGTAALDQAEAEYKDFITFFPDKPEAAEAQMRVGDIYFKEMDKPDRDNAKMLGAEREYRIMLQQFPDAPKVLIDQATQRLRDVQEALATREMEEGQFYAEHENRPAAIAHFQTVVDTYPLYSRMDEVLIALGDQYEAQAGLYRASNLPEDPKAELEKKYHDAAADAYNKVVLEHAASLHVEDAKDRLAAMNRPIPTPTAEQLAASTAMENSRSSYTITNRAALLFLHRPDVVQAARIGQPTLVDPKPTVAPDIVNELNEDFRLALAGKPLPPVGSKVSADVASAGTTTSGAASGEGGVSAPLKLEDVTTSKSVDNGSSATTVVNEARPATASSGTRTGVGITIVTPPNANADTNAPAATTAPATNKSGLSAVGPTDNKPLPPVEKAAAPPTQVDEVPQPTQSGNTTAAPNKKPKNAPVDKSAESSSKDKPKKGIGKLNPF